MKIHFNGKIEGKSTEWLYMAVIIAIVALLMTDKPSEVIELLKICLLLMMQKSKK